APPPQPPPPVADRAVPFVPHPLLPPDLHATHHGEVRGAPDALGGKLQRRGILEQGRHGADLLDVEIAADQAGAAVAADREERLGPGERDGSAARGARGGPTLLLQAVQAWGAPQ